MEVFCPHCNQNYELDSSLLRKKAECGVCNKSFIVKLASKCTKKRIPRPILKEEIQTAKNNLKTVKKYIDLYSKIEELTKEDFVSEKTFDIFESYSDELWNLENNWEEYIETLQELTDHRKDIFKQWKSDWSEYDTKEFYQKPSKIQFDELMDYLDVTFGIEWSDAQNSESIFERGIKEIIPELIL